jgi:hypothetical protein
MSQEATLPAPLLHGKDKPPTKFRELVGNRALVLTTQSQSPVTGEILRFLKDEEEASHAPLDLHLLIGEAQEIVFPGPTGVPIPEETIAWIRAGDLFEKLIQYLARSEKPDTLLILDPWAALTLARGVELSPGSKCLFISDLAERGRGRDAEYWGSTAQWIEGLPIDQVLTLEELGFDPEAPCRPAPQPRQEDSPLRLSPRPPLPSQSRPAWRWKEIARGAPEPLSTETPSPAFALVHRGTPLHLAASLRALGRQDGLADRIPLWVLARHPGVGTKRVIEILDKAHPALALRGLSMPGPEDDWADAARRLLQVISPRPLILLDDFTLVPRDYSMRLKRDLRAKNEAVLFGRRTLDAESAARVLAGTLDPDPRYEELLRGGRAMDPSNRPAALALAEETGAEPEALAERLRSFAGFSPDGWPAAWVHSGDLLSFPEDP